MKRAPTSRIISAKRTARPKPPQYQSRAGAQAAHEAIRPTSVLRRPEDVKPYLNRDQYRLYRLIWERFVASQMSPAVFDTLTVDIEADGLIFRATGSTMKFPGYMSVYTEGRDDGETDEATAEGSLPAVEQGERLQCTRSSPSSTLPSRLRDSPKRCWSKRWRSWALDVPALTCRSSTRSSDGAM